MSFSSCIKLPSFKTENSPEKDISSRGNMDNDKQTYNELITIANEIFGHGKWSHAVTSQTVDFVEYVMGRYLIGCAAFVRVQLPDGTFHEEMGYSNAESSVKGTAVFEARVSSITNALKKSLLCFGGIIETKINEKISSHKSKIQKTSDNKLFQNDQRAKTEPSKVSTSNSEILEYANSPKERMRKESLREEKKDGLKEPKKDEVKVINSVSTTTSTVQLIKAPSKSTENTPRTTAMTEEELRIERKRKQKEKQEEYRRQMMLKGEEIKIDDKVQKDQ
ncbi:GSCOCG00007703001-RA-CDS [Cotesia congregata]|uniref:Similar to RAD52: DNA repair protein RAD52 homolog (Gallus gallus) n=1 Tax=Cotesia congregata TaxID=51543 RepID=A0A8J2HJI3_COTCN|nr:GSCOCG00007703001-RA-CDS [Cotesia congregata]CAG5099450.1 Similar to RAD52: DNA repair protein RAD52 homolog (Gallus gallus) [Cotesia congregata]